MKNKAIGIDNIIKNFAGSRDNFEQFNICKQSWRSNQDRYGTYEGCFLLSMLNLVCTEMAVSDVGKKWLDISEEINKQSNRNEYIGEIFEPQILFFF